MIILALMCTITFILFMAYDFHSKNAILHYAFKMYGEHKSSYRTSMAYLIACITCFVITMIVLIYKGNFVE